MRERNGKIPPIALLALTALACVPTDAQAQQANVSALKDVAFGAITNFSADLSNSQSICVYSTGTGGQYHVTATGSGSGGAFTLSSGNHALTYEVQWSSSAGQTGGRSLLAGVALTGQISGATESKCASGTSASASLITILRATQLSGATAGSYRGTLTLLIAPN